MKADIDDSKQRILKARKLFTLREEIVEKLAAVDNELLAVLGGKETIADKVRRTQTAFSDAWSVRYQGSYLFNFVKDTPNVKRLLKTFEVEELAERAVSYLFDDDDFLRRTRHPFGVFVTSVNKYAGLNALTDFTLDSDEAPSDCKHTPRCRTATAHTAKRTAERKIIE